MINWDEVTVGETEVVDTCGQKYLVLCRDGHMVWMKFGVCYYTRAIDSMRDWTIYDPWEEITDQCRWGKWVEMDDGFYWMLHHDGKPVSNDHINYKSDGRRVWKRKETHQ